MKLRTDSARGRTHTQTQDCQQWPQCVEKHDGVIMTNVVYSPTQQRL